MINKLYIFLLTFLIDLLDRNNKKKVTSFFKNKLFKKSIVVIDVGAHKGETIRLFLNNFNIKKIFAIEPNPEIFLNLKTKYTNNDKIKLYNIGLSSKYDSKELKIFNDTSSSTFSEIDENTEYFKRKKKFLTLFSSTLDYKLYKVNLIPLSNLITKNNLKNIDILKIDTEGYEFNVLKGIENQHYNIISYIYFEHHYDLMIKKNYKFTEINNFLSEKNFELKFKIKMSQRKTFEYIYENKK